MNRHTAGYFLLLIALLAGGCASRESRSRNETLYIGGVKRTAGIPERRANFDNVSYWDGDGAPGAPSVRISLSEQRAYFYKGGQLVGVSIISTGREGFGTPTGSWGLQQKDLNHKSSLYGDYVDGNGGIIRKDVDTSKDKRPPGAIFDGAKMPFFMRIHGGVGMHEGFLPGYPASHGCIRMPGFMAEKFFHNVSVGTPVTIAH
jgi:lipoprotein-anchoring transpeptidase ErfK/SrfK